MQKESGAAAAAAFCVRLSSASLFLPIASSLCHSRSLGAPARARDIAPFTRRGFASYLAAREIPYGKNIWRRETGARTTVVVRRYAEGEKICERNPPLKRMNREPTACPSPRNFRTKIVTGTRRRVLVESIPYRARYIYMYARARVIITPRAVLLLYNRGN